jgi:hypothetical protein
MTHAQPSRAGSCTAQTARHMTQVMMMDNPDLNGVDFPFAGGRSAVHTTSPLRSCVRSLECKARQSRSVRRYVSRTPLALPTASNRALRPRPHRHDLRASAV